MFINSGTGRYLLYQRLNKGRPIASDLKIFNIIFMCTYIHNGIITVIIILLMM